ncbi:LytS/YhcK type 5TM receptor domain-containing protein [Rhizobium etli]|nr:LytS/YhcK type 5TM receptor domain-containing protein [Rhizobium etli]
MGLGAIASMLLSIPVNSGAFIDLRSSLIAISGLFGGPVAAIATMAKRAPFRYLQAEPEQSAASPASC